jgi:hypothetical protein
VSNACSDPVLAAASTSTTATLAIVHGHSCDRVIQLRAYFLQLFGKLGNRCFQFLDFAVFF